MDYYKNIVDSMVSAMNKNMFDHVYNEFLPMDENTKQKLNQVSDKEFTSIINTVNSKIEKDIQDALFGSLEKLTDTDHYHSTTINNSFTLESLNRTVREMQKNSIRITPSKFIPKGTIYELNHEKFREDSIEHNKVHNELFNTTMLKGLSMEELKKIADDNRINIDKFLYPRYIDKNSYGIQYIMNPLDIY